MFAGLRKASPTVVISAQCVRELLKLSLEISNSLMRRNHVLDDDNIPQMTPVHLGVSDVSLIARFTEICSKLYGCKIGWENDSKVDIAGPTQVISFSFQSPKHIAVIVVPMNHR